MVLIYFEGRANRIRSGMGEEEGQRYYQGFRSVKLEEQRHIPLNDPKVSSDSESV